MNSSVWAVWAELAVRKKSDFVYCWTFEILHLHICLLLNLWTFFTTEPLRLSVAAESLDFLYCWTFEIICCCWTFGFSLLLNLWDYALDYVSVYCWTFGFYLLLNLWNYLFASEPLDFLYCWTFGFFLLLNIWDYAQRYTYRVLQTIQMKLMLLCVWAERAVLGSAKTALKFKYEI